MMIIWRTDGQHTPKGETQDQYYSYVNTYKENNDFFLVVVRRHKKE